MSEPLLSARDITKSFPGVKALAGVQLDLYRGEIHALMGENGAGKSTLIKIITGVYQRDGGAILFRGQEIHPRSPKDAEACGISTVYQEVNLIPTLSIAENIMLGRLPRKLGIIQWGAARRQAAKALQRLGLELDVDRELRASSIAIQQMVAIARALDVQAEVLVLDEPTSSLDEKEVAALFAVLRKLRDEGLAIMFVSHFLDQIYALTDRLTVLRNGQFIGAFKTAELPRLDLLGKMLGRAVESDHAAHQPPEKSAQRAGKPVVEAAAIARSGSVGPITLQVAEGEVLGLGGLLGSGRTETARMLFGIDPHDAGEIRAGGETAPLRTPAEAIRRGFAFCSEDRKIEGILPNLSVRENLIFAMQASRGALRQISIVEQTQLADHYIRALNIKTPSPETPIRNLSGGNQQKVLLARWLAMQPKLIILDEPTRGIDVGAKAEIEKLIASLREKGLAVLFISSELDEVVRVSSRVVVLRDRKQVGELEGTFDEDQVLHLIAQPTNEQ
ncbi:MAG TPA: sugar ABC transporter ATP-binding protein [Chthoniobacteraceae bacterium]|jgi:simple sugar transport system ATP-binding protein